MASISTFSTQGKTTVYGSFGSGTPGFRQANGQVYVRPRRTLSDQIGAGSNVRVTNPAAQPRMQARRSRGIGMGVDNATFQKLAT